MQGIEHVDPQLHRFLFNDRNAHEQNYSEILWSKDFTSEEGIKQAFSEANSNPYPDGSSPHHRGFYLSTSFIEVSFELYRSTVIDTSIITDLRSRETVPASLNPTVDRSIYLEVALEPCRKAQKGPEHRPSFQLMPKHIFTGGRHRPESFEFKLQRSV